MSDRHDPGSNPIRDGGQAVFVGAITFDTIALVASAPGPDERVVADQICSAGGGPAATAAVAAARLGVSSAVIGAVGDDDEGRRALDGLRQEGVDTQGVAVVPGRQTQASLVVVHAASGTRTICTRAVPPLQLDGGPAVRDLLAGATWVHADHLGWPAVRALGLRRGGTRLSVDAGNPVPGLAPADVDLFVPTLEALERSYGRRSPQQLLDAAIEDGAGTVVATRGADGSLAATSDGQRAEAPGHPVDVCSTLGAGDVFHGALVAAMVHGLPLPRALHYANVAAALSCRGLDGRSAIPTHDEVQAVLPHAPSPHPLTTLGGHP